MRLQGISIIFALVCLPIVLVIAYRISLQIDTITLQNQYNSKLLDATYDAMSAFELNTANEDLSSVSDSLRTIIEASDNVFMNTLATNMGMSNASKSYLEPFIPSILHTLYDGYYISAPTYAPTVVTDSNGNAVSVGDWGVTQNTDGTFDYKEVVIKTDEYGNEIYYQGGYDENQLDQNKINNGESIKINVDQLKDKTTYGQLLYYTNNTERSSYVDGTYHYTNCTTSVEAAPKGNKNSTDAKYKTKNVLKSYIPYSARYVQNNLSNGANVDINVIYTLDNYVTIEGTFTYPNIDNRKIYYTKSGYLLPFKNGNITARIFLNDETDWETPLKYNQNEIQEYIEAGRPITVKILKSLDLEPNDPNNWETIIKIDDSNKSLIDETKSNRNSDNARLTRYENLVFDLKELEAKITSKHILPIDPDGATKNYLLKSKPTNLEEDLTPAGTVIIAAQTEINKDNKSKEEYISSLPETISEEDLFNFIKECNEFLKPEINKIKYNMQLNSAAVYYAKAAIFSQWVADNLSDLKINSIKDISGLNYTTYSEVLINNASGDEYNYLKVWQDEGLVFGFTDGDNTCSSTEIRKDSSFYNHKLGIIRTSIQYNLNLSMSAYNRHIYYADDEETYAFDKNTDYAMPIMTEKEWEQILTNISFVSFMQGLDCGLKKYNNYVVVSSTNNEVMTTADNIFYAKDTEFNNENAEYHRYNCNKLIEEDLKNNAVSGAKEFNYISFTSKEVKYDKISTDSNVIPYEYDHKNLACYDCINDGNYSGKNIFQYWKNPEAEPPETKIVNDDFDKYYNLRRAFYIGVAKERNDIYKMNAVKESEGFEILYNGMDKGLKDTPSILPMNDIKEIEIVFGSISSIRQDEDTVSFKVRYDGNILKKEPGTNDSVTYSLPINSTNVQYTWYVKVEHDIGINESFTLNKMTFENQNPNSAFLEPLPGESSYANEKDKLVNAIKSIRIIYK